MLQGWGTGGQDVGERDCGGPQAVGAGDEQEEDRRFVCRHADLFVFFSDLSHLSPVCPVKR